MKTRYSSGGRLALQLAAWILLLCAANVSAGQISQFGTDLSVVDKVKQAAEDGLDRWLGAIPEQDMEHYGFSDGASFDGVTLGQPYCVHTLTPEALKSIQVDTDMSGLMTATNMWFVPLLQDGQARCMLTVDLMPEGWRAVAIGDLQVSRDLVDLQRQYADYDQAFLRVFQATADFLVVERDGQVQLAPFESSRRALGLTGTGQLLETVAVARQLAPIVQQNIEQHQR